MSRNRRAGERGRLADGLRLLAWVAFFVAVVSTFRQPFDRVLGHRLRPVLAAIGADRLLGIAPAPGFMLQVTSRPSGAAVRIDGIERGKTPALLNVTCRQGEKVVIEVELAGRSTRRTVECREGGRLEANLPLPAAGGGG